MATLVFITIIIITIIQIQALLVDQQSLPANKVSGLRHCYIPQQQKQTNEEKKMDLTLKSTVVNIVFSFATKGKDDYNKYYI